MKKLLLLLLCLVLFSSCKRIKIIKPGIGVNGYTLLKTKTTDIYYGDKDDNYYATRGLDFRFNKDDLLYEIIVFNNNYFQYKTKDNLTIGSSIDDIKKVYGSIDIEEFNVPKDTLFAKDDGIVFIIDKNTSRVIFIGVVPKGQQFYY